MPVVIAKATPQDLADAARLFDAYRQFYGNGADLALATRFLSERLHAQDSTILIARDEDGQATGFAQLFPSFTSVACARIYILNDLFVVPERRGERIGGALLDAAAQFGRDQGAVRLTLNTNLGNSRARAVYAAMGWQPNGDILMFNLAL